MTSAPGLGLDSSAAQLGVKNGRAAVRSISVHSPPSSLSDSFVGVWDWPLTRLLEGGMLHISCSWDALFNHPLHPRRAHRLEQKPVFST